VTLTCMGFALACGSESDPPPAGSGLTFCDAEPIIANKCQRCHDQPTRNGAPFPLLTYADTQVSTPTPGDPERKRYQDMWLAVEQGEMPYRALTLDPPVQGLTCEERTTLLTWLREDAPAPPEAHPDCAGVTPRRLACDEDL
jgi:hypothetical protein